MDTGLIASADTEYIGISKIRMLNKKNLREIKGPIVVLCPHSPKPLAVIVPYAQFMAMQAIILMSNVGHE